MFDFFSTLTVMEIKSAGKRSPPFSLSHSEQSVSTELVSRSINRKRNQEGHWVYGCRWIERTGSIQCQDNTHSSIQVNATQNTHKTTHNITRTHSRGGRGGGDAERKKAAVRKKKKKTLRYSSTIDETAALDVCCVLQAVSLLAVRNKNLGKFQEGVCFLAPVNVWQQYYIYQQL